MSKPLLKTPFSRVLDDESQSGAENEKKVLLHDKIRFSNRIDTTLTGHGQMMSYIAFVRPSIFEGKVLDP